MKNLWVLSLALLILPACSKKFSPPFEKGQKAFEANNFVEAIDALNQALPRWRDSDGQEKKAQAYQLLGKSYHKLLKIDKATESYLKAVELSNQTYDSAYALGNIYALSVKHDLAMKSFKDALRMRKDDPWALLGLGNALYAKGQYEEARVIYKRIIETAPGVNDALGNLKLIDQKMSLLKHFQKRAAPTRRRR